MYFDIGYCHHKSSVMCTKEIMNLDEVLDMQADQLLKELLTEFIVARLSN